MTRYLSTWRGWLFAIFAAVLLTACDPIVDIVAPTDAEVGVPITLTSERLPQFKDAEFADLQYEWDFGDGAKAAGQQVAHVYAQPGDYEVVLSVTDASVRNWGQAYISKKTIKVAPYTGALVPVSVRVYDDQGRTVQGATVSMGERSAQTDLAGGVLIAPAMPMRQPVAVIRKSGYLTQSVRVPDGQAAERGVVVTLKKEAPAIVIDDITAAQWVEPPEANLTPRVQLPAQAFVNAKGETVSGTATVRISPWDITSAADMAAFPGNAQADDGTGRLVSLISFGMLSIEFEQGGEKLQLAPGKRAVISMQLPIVQDTQGRDIQPGDSIPLWHFNEARGVWEREGDGVVVASEASATGLEVRAEVGHFSSWNWDKIAEPEVRPVSRLLSCQAPDREGAFKPLATTDVCIVSIQQRRPNGQVLADSLVIRGGEFVSFDRFVSDATVTIGAEALQAGYRGSSTATISAADAGLPWVIKLDAQLIIDQMLGDVAVVPDAQTVVEFLVKNGSSYQRVRTEEVKVFAKSSVDGTLTEWPFPLFSIFESYESDPQSPDISRLRFSLHGGGNASGQDGVGRFSGQFVAKIPVDRDFEINDKGEFAPTSTEWIEAEFTVAPKTYSGPTAIHLTEMGFAFALWDEVGVSSSIRPDSVVEFRYQIIDDGWLSTTAGRWLRADVPFARAPDAAPMTMNQGPYFAVTFDCESLRQDAYGTHRFIGQVKITDPVTNRVKLYELRPFVATVRAPACT